MIYQISKLSIPASVRESSYYEKWLQFHLENREIIRLILTELERAKNHGLNKVSIKQICGKIRWEMSLETKSDDFKINDAFTSLYAHVIAHNFPEYRTLFNRKKIRATK